MRTFSHIKTAFAALALLCIGIPAFAACPTGWTGFGTCGLAGTAALVNTGTSGHTLPYLDGNNTWSGTNAFNSTVSGTGITGLFASPPAIGGSAAAAGAFTTLSASSTVSGTGFSTYLASPPAIGGTAPAAGHFTTFGATGLTSTAASTTGGAGLNLPAGTAPTAPNDGDVWTTTAGIYVQINGSTIGPLGTGGGGTPANPTATAGPAAVNGSASTYMRSDGAPAVQKASSSQFGIVEVDGTTITATGGVISSVSGGAGTVTTITAGTNISLSSGATCTTICTINATGGSTSNAVYAAAFSAIGGM